MNCQKIKFKLGKCKTKAAYSAKPLQKGTLNLEKVKPKFEVIMDSPILVMVKHNNIEIVVHKHGEILFKNCEDHEFMEQTTKEIYQDCLE